MVWSRNLKFARKLLLCFLSSLPKSSENFEITNFVKLPSAFFFSSYEIKTLMGKLNPLLYAKIGSAVCGIFLRVLHLTFASILLE